MNPNDAPATRALPTPRSDDKKQQVKTFASHCVEKLAIALGQEIPAKRLSMYVQGLSDLTENQLRHGFTRALKEFVPNFGVNFPMIGTLREWCLSLVDTSAQEVVEAYRHESTPLPEREEYAHALVAAMHKKIEAGLWGIPSHNVDMERMAAARNGKTQVPKDPKDRKPWATDKAKKQGWI